MQRTAEKILTGTGLGTGNLPWMQEPVVSARALTKHFDDFVAVDSVDFDVRPGEAFGFLGPNGAGKSSTMKMIGAVSPITSGTLTVFGMDPATEGRQIRARLGVVPQEDNLDQELTVEENLIIYGRYFDLPRSVIRPRIDELLAFAQLEDRRTSKVEPLSGGMKRRLTIARSLISEPDVVLLDEPTTGLDPQARHLLWERLYQLKERGVTLIITTHYMDEAEQLCDRLVIMDHGKIVAEGSPAQLIANNTSRDVLELRFPTEGRPESISRLDGIGKKLEILPDRVLVSTDDAEASLAEVYARDLHPIANLVRRSTLEDVFLALTGRTLVD